MSTYREARSIACPADLLFELVADVESYPQFLPFWREARIIRRDHDVYYTEQSIGVGPLSDRFQTKTLLDSPGHIVIEPHRAERLFNRFHIDWRFDPITAESSRVRLNFDVEPRSRLLRHLVENLLREAAQGMLVGFEQRAVSRFRPKGNS